MSHFQYRNIMTHLNHGFRSGFSCDTQLLTTTHDLLKSFDAGKQVDIAILDFSKAFVKVPHKKLLHRLDHYGRYQSARTHLAHNLPHPTEYEGCVGRRVL